MLQPSVFHIWKVLKLHFGTLTQQCPDNFTVTTGRKGENEPHFSSFFFFFFTKERARELELSFVLNRVSRGAHALMSQEEKHAGCNSVSFM